MASRRPRTICLWRRRTLPPLAPCCPAALERIPSMYCSRVIPLSVFGALRAFSGFVPTLSSSNCHFSVGVRSRGSARLLSLQCWGNRAQKKSQTFLAPPFPQVIAPAFSRNRLCRPAKVFSRTIGLRVGLPFADGSTLTGIRAIRSMLRIRGSARRIASARHPSIFDERVKGMP